MGSGGCCGTRTELPHIPTNTNLPTKFAQNTEQHQIDSGFGSKYQLSEHTKFHIDKCQNDKSTQPSAKKQHQPDYPESHPSFVSKGIRSQTVVLDNLLQQLSNESINVILKNPGNLSDNTKHKHKKPVLKKESMNGSQGLPQPWKPKRRLRTTQ